MSTKPPRGQAVQRQTKKPIVLVFGENEHDTKALCRLVEGLRPDLKGVVQSRREPLVLIKGATPETAKNNAQRIASLAKQEGALRRVLAVLAHQDCDAIEPSHKDLASDIERSLTDAGCPGLPVGVAPAWEMEAWWMVFPEAVGKIVLGWRDPDDWIGHEVGKLPDAKEKLAHAVQPRQKRAKHPRAYEERDSIQIAANIVTDNLLRTFSKGRRSSHHKANTPTLTPCASFDEFRTKVLAIPT